jgi:phosphoketolase
MMNDIDRYHLVMDVIDRVPGRGPRAAHIRQLMEDCRPKGTTVHEGRRRGPAGNPELDLAFLTI